MPRTRYSMEQILLKLREAEVELTRGPTTPAACRKIGVSTQTFYRWRTEYGGLKIDQARRLKQLERENARLKKLVAECFRWAPGGRRFSDPPAHSNAPKLHGLVKRSGSPVRTTCSRYAQ